MSEIQETIAVFGDSHVRCFLPHEQLDGFYSRPDQFNEFEYAGYLWRVMKIGSTGATVYGLVNENSETQGGQTIARLADTLQHVVLFLGEVDVRSHISGKDDPWASTADVMARYRKFLEESVIPHVSGKVIVANSFGHSLDSLRVHGNAALSVIIFNSELRALARSLGVGYLNSYKLSVDELGVVPESNIESDGLLCHIVPDMIRDSLRRETVRLVRA